MRTKAIEKRNSEEEFNFVMRKSGAGNREGVIEGIHIYISKCNCRQ